MSDLVADQFSISTSAELAARAFIHGFFCLGTSYRLHRLTLLHQLDDKSLGCYPK